MSQPIPTTVDVLIVGGGIAGLTAAWRALSHGHTPWVIEARGYVGGLIAGSTLTYRPQAPGKSAESEEIAVNIDLGAEGFVDRGGVMSALLESMNLSVITPEGSGAHLFTSSTPSQTPASTQENRWQALPLPQHSLLGIPADPGAADVRRIIGDHAAHEALERDRLPLAEETYAPGVTVSDLVRARHGEGVLSRLVHPMMCAIYTADPARLDCDSVLPFLRPALRKHGSLSQAVRALRANARAGGDVSVNGGMAHLVAMLVEHIRRHGGDVITRTGAQHLERTEHGWTVTLAPTAPGPTPGDEPVPAGEHYRVHATHVVIACNAAPAQRLLNQCGVNTRVDVPHGAPVGRVNLLVRCPDLNTAPLGSGAIVAPPPPGATCPVGAKALSHLTVKWPWMAHQLPPDHHVLRLSYGHRDPITTSQACHDASLITGVTINDTMVLSHSHARWDGSLPPFTPEYRERVTALLKQVASLPGLGVCGAWVSGSGVHAAVTHAATCVDDLFTQGPSSHHTGHASPTLRSHLLLGTRGSDLARTQSRLVADAIEEEAHNRAIPVKVSLTPVRTVGDSSRARLASLGGLGVFAAKVRSALLDGQCDLAVHSLKDVPTQHCDGLTIAAVPPRAHVADALCARDGHTLMSLPAGSTVGTGSPRRSAQIRRLRPDLTCVDIRGNVPTRLARVFPDILDHKSLRGDVTGKEPHHGDPGDLDAVVLAVAGLQRLGLDEWISEVLDPDVWIPAPAQGALAVECRESDTEMRQLLSWINDTDSYLAVHAERTVMRDLSAGCATPVGAWARRVNTHLVLSAHLLSPDATRLLCAQASTPEFSLQAARALGHEVAQSLRDQGAQDIIAACDAHYAPARRQG